MKIKVIITFILPLEKFVMGEAKISGAYLSRTEIINSVLKGKKKLESSTGSLDNINEMWVGTENY